MGSPAHPDIGISNFLTNCKLGDRPSKLGQGVFYFYNRREIIGIVSLFVDDLLWAGNSQLVSAIFYQIFIFSPNDSPSKIMKNLFYFI